jgi:hypothetical protein
MINLYIMSRNPNGVLINNDNIYGLVNPPPAPLASDDARPYQDISSGAVRWDTFVDLSNNGFSFQPANFLFSSIIDKIPYPDVQLNRWYPTYQKSQITFTQTKTFSKFRLWIKGRRGNVTGIGDSLKTQMPNSSLIGGAPGTANWAGAEVNPPGSGIGNRDGLQNFNTTGIWDTGISEGQTAVLNGGFDVWDISGPTRLADSTGTGTTYAFYKDINPNGWNLGWYLIITEIAPDGTTKYLSNKMSWQTGTNNIGIPLFYNPKAVAIALSTDANPFLSSFAVPELSKNESTGAQSLNYANVTYASWANSPDYSLVGHIIHSMRTKHVGDNLWYCEKDLGYQLKNPAFIPPQGLQDWVDVPITFTKGYSYLANICMTNVEKMVSQTILTGPGLANVDALTYLELIV